MDTASVSSLSVVQAMMPVFYMRESTGTGLLLTLGGESIRDGLNLDQLAASDRCKGKPSTNASSPFRVPSACGGNVAPNKIGLAPDTPFARDYCMATMA